MGRCPPWSRLRHKLTRSSFGMLTTTISRSRFSASKQSFSSKPSRSKSVTCLFSRKSIHAWSKQIINHPLALVKNSSWVSRFWSWSTRSKRVLKCRLDRRFFLLIDLALKNTSSLVWLTRQHHRSSYENNQRHLSNASKCWNKPCRQLVKLRWVTGKNHFSPRSWTLRPSSSALNTKWGRLRTEHWGKWRLYMRLLARRKPSPHSHTNVVFQRSTIKKRAFKV